jgi:hypothetical protein
LAIWQVAAKDAESGGAEDFCQRMKHRTLRIAASAMGEHQGVTSRIIWRMQKATNVWFQSGIGEYFDGWHRPF